MCEVITDSVVDTLSVSQVESALAAFSQAAFLRSSTHAPDRRFSFDVPLPVHIVDTSVAQKALRPAAAGAETGVLMAEPLPLLAGGALVVGWYAQMQQALFNAEEDEVTVFKLFEADLSVPIRFKILYWVCFAKMRSPRRADEGIPSNYTNLKVFESHRSHNGFTHFHMQTRCNKHYRWI